MTYFWIIVAMAVLASLSGGSFPFSQLLHGRDEVYDDGSSKGGLMPFNMTWLPELLFAVVIGFSSVRGFENLGVDMSFLRFFAVWAGTMAWAFLWMQTGHAAILPWDKVDTRPEMSRDNTLTPFVRWLCDLLKIEWFRYKPGLDGGNDYPVYTEAYVWTFAGVKGFLIGLPVGGVLLAGLWPFGYEIGSHAKNHLADKTGVDLHIVSEGAAGAGAGIACVAWLSLTAAIGVMLHG